MGLGLDSFLDLTPFEWMGIKCKYLEQKDKDRQMDWEIARWTVFKIACPPQPKTKGQLFSVKDFIVFPWEEDEKKAEITNEEKFRAAVKRYE